MINIKKVIIGGTLIRLVCSLLSNTYLSNRLTQCHSLKSILTDPLYLMSHFRESCHLSRLYIDGLMSVSANSRFTVKPIMLLAFIDRILETISKFVSLNAIFALVAILIDLMTTIQLYRLAQNLTNTIAVDVIWEQKMEEMMNPLIHPKHAWIFGKRFGTKYEVKSEKADSVAESEKYQAILTISDIPQLCCALYYLNPVTVLATSMFPSFQGVQYLLLVSIFQQITSAQNESATVARLRLFISGFLLAVLTHFEVYCFTYISPLIWCIRYLKNINTNHSTMYCIGSFLLSFFAINALLLMLSASDDIHSMMLQIDTGRNHSTLSPSIGMQWYLFMNLFGRCRQFFVVSTKGFPFLFFIPFSVRFYRYPIAVVGIFHLLFCLLKQNPTLHDMSFGLALLVLEPRSLMRMGKIALIAILAIPVPIVLYVVDYWLWLESGAGNPNYLFFQSLAYTLFLMSVLMQFISCTMMRDKALRLTERGPKVQKVL